MQIVADLKNMFHIRYLIATGHASSKSKHNLRIYKETGPTNIGKTVNKIYRRNNMEKDQKARRKAEKRAKRMPALEAVDERKKEVEVPQQGSLRLRGGAPSPEPERPSNIKEAYDELDEIEREDFYRLKCVQDKKKIAKEKETAEMEAKLKAARAKEGEEAPATPDVTENEGNEAKSGSDILWYGKTFYYKDLTYLTFIF